MIPSWATAVLLGLGFGLFALVGALLRWQRPSVRRLERVVTFGLMGGVCIVLGTAQVAFKAIGPADPDLGESVVVAAVLPCVPLCVVGFPLVHWLAARRYGRRPPGASDYAEGRGGNAVRVPRE